MNTNIQAVRLKAITTTDAEGIHVSVYAEGIAIGRPYVFGWLLKPNHKSLASRLSRAVEAHKAIVPKGILTDEDDGTTYLDYDCFVLGRYVNTDLNRLGF